MNKIFIDVNIPMYAAGRQHPYQIPCQRIIHAIAEKKLNAVTDAEVFQEILHRFSAIKALDIGFKLFDDFAVLLAGSVLPVTAEDMALARKLNEKYPRIKSRDHVHAAVMLANGVASIFSVDKEFDEIKEIKRVEPK